MNKILEELFNINSNYIKTINSYNIISGDDLMNIFDFIDSVKPLIEDVVVSFYNWNMDVSNIMFIKGKTTEELYKYFINHIYKPTK